MRQDTPLQQALRACRGAGLFLILFSCAINLLTLASPLYMMQLYDRVVSSRSVDTLVMLTLILALSLAVIAVLDGLRGQVLARLGVWLDDRLGPPVIIAGLRMARTSPGVVQSGEAMRDLATLRGFLSGPATTPLMDAPWAPLFLALLFVLHPLLGLIGLLSGCALFGLAFLNEVLTKRPLKESNLAVTASLRVLNAAFRNAEAIEAMGMRDGILRLWRREGMAGQQAHRVAARRAVVVQVLSRFVRLFVQSAIMGAAAWLVIEDNVSAGVMFGASFLIARALAPVENAIVTWRTVVSARLAYRRLQELLQSNRAPPKGMPLPAPQGHLSVERLVFIPPGSESPTLRGISFTLDAGEVLGIVGPSAAGKTTLARCLTGAWVPSSGHVRLDGADIDVWLAANGGEHIGYLPQDVELFAGSVRENIARLRDAEPGPVIEAARLAGLHGTIMRLPRGYDSEIGESGVKLSGGQRQRVALARALFGRPQLVVLDEPNASLDSEGEAALIEAIAELKKRGTTIVIIAHRPSILQHADKLLVLRDGVVEILGSRTEVFAKLNVAASGVAIGRPRAPAAPPQVQSASAPR